MSVRVNLLPGDVEAKNKARRGRAMMAVAGVVFLGLLAAAYLFQLGRVGDAEDELAREQAVLTDLQAQVRELQEFADLKSRLDGAQGQLVELLGGEASLAGILQDVAAIMPSDSALTTLSITIDAEPSLDPLGVGGLALGELTGAGSTLRGHAPGVERFILEFEKVAAFFNVFLSNSSINPETGESVFTFDLQLGPEVLTGRYLQGLPEELR